MPLGGGSVCMERIDEEENAVMDEMNIFQPRAPFSGTYDDMEVNEVTLGKCIAQELICAFPKIRYTLKSFFILSKFFNFA